MPSIGKRGFETSGRVRPPILSMERMKFTFFILPALAILALEMVAFAQEPTVRPTVRLESVTTEAAESEVRINIDASAAVESPGSVVIYDDSLVWDLPGVASGENGQHLIVDRGGVRDIFVSLQQRTPPLTRITVRLSSLHPYSLSTAGRRISLRIGADPKARANQPQGGALPTARQGPVGAIGGIFRRPLKEAVNSSPQGHPSLPAQSGPPPAPLPPLHLPEATRAEQGAGTASAGQTAAADKNVTAGSQPPATPTKAVSAPPSLRAEGTPQNVGARATAPTPAPAQQQLPIVRAAPGELMAALNAPRTPSPELVSASAQPPIAAAPATVTELKAGPVVPNADLRTVFHVKFVQQDSAYIDAGRNAGVAEGMKLVVVSADPKGALRNNTSPTAALAELTVVGIAETSAVT